MVSLSVSEPVHRRAVAVLLFLSCICLFPSRSLPQVIFIPMGGGVPQAETRDELDAFGIIYDQKDAASVVKAAQAFAQDFPNSKFQEYAAMAAMHAYEDMGDRKGSGQMAQVILKSNPKNLDALLTMAEVTLDESSEDPDPSAQWDKASDYARRGIAELKRYTLPHLANPRYWLRTKRGLLAHGHSILGRAALCRRDFDEAIQNFDESVGLRVDGADFYFEALAYEGKGQLEEAQALLMRARELGTERVSQLASQELERMANAAKTRR